MLKDANKQDPFPTFAKTSTPVSHQCVLQVQKSGALGHWGLGRPKLGTDVAEEFMSNRKAANILRNLISNKPVWIEGMKKQITFPRMVLLLRAKKNYEFDDLHLPERTKTPSYIFTAV